MTITCFIRYEIAPFKKDQFTAYSENWARIIPRLGGHLLGYIAPHEGRCDVPAAALGFTVDDMDQAKPTAPSRVAYRCLDWSERRDHMAGKLPSVNPL